MTPSIVISILALLFTVSSFWWIQVRRGNIVCAIPRTYASDFGNDRVIVVLPLVLHNTGPAPIVIEDFRLWLTKPDWETPLLYRWQAVQPGIIPAPPNGGRVFPSPYPVEGRRAVERFIEFGCKTSGFAPTDGPYEAKVEIKMSHKDDWLGLATFDLNTQLSRETRGFIVRPNDPEWEEP